MHWTGGELDLEALVNDPTMWWSLIGPKSTILLEADQAHFFITFSSSVLWTWARTYHPSRLLAAFCVLYDGLLDECDESWEIAGLTVQDRRDIILQRVLGLLHASALKLKRCQIQRDRDFIKEWISGWKLYWPRLQGHFMAWADIMEPGPAGRRLSLNEEQNPVLA
jgi:hypothetical protein